MTGTRESSPSDDADATPPAVSGLNGLSAATISSSKTISTNNINTSTNTRTTNDTNGKISSTTQQQSISNTSSTTMIGVDRGINTTKSAFNNNNANSSSTRSNATASSSGRPRHSHVGKASKTSRRKVIELMCAEIRWFYRRDADAKWLPFKGYDSTILEFAYRRRRDIPLDEGMVEIGDSLPNTDDVIVLNGLYRLNKDNDDEVVPIYWKDEPLKIRRGTWFFADSIQPLSTDLAEAIEKQHLIGFRGQIIPEAPVFSETESSKKPVLISLKWSETEEVRWNSVIDVSISNLKRGNRLFRLVTRARSMINLRRGFTDETRFADGRPNFSDLILVVHGIGQKGYENLIAKNTSQIRDGIHQLMEKNYPDEDRRPIILPIEWRSALQLDGNLTEVITLPRMPSMRNALNSVAMDIMYYQSPLYRTEIVNGVIRTMNNVYTMFKRNNPDFNGNVSIYAHSLGSVIAYDILTGWSPFLLYDQYVTNAIQEHIDACSGREKQLLEEFYTSRKKLLESGGSLQQILYKSDEELKFKVKYLFCVGSPLAVFVIMRGANSTEILTDKLDRIFNIFHPYDPVAYRLEPLFHENYRHIRPAKLFSYNDAKHQYDNLPFECHKSYLKRKKKELVSRGKAGEDLKLEKIEENESDSGDECSSIHTACSSPRSESPMGRRSAPPPHPPPPNFNAGQRNESEPTTREVAPPDPLLVGEAGELIEAIVAAKRVPMRIDFQIQPALTDKSYWSVLKSHFGYWTNLDVTAFLVNALYPALPAVSTSLQHTPTPSTSAV